MIVFVIKLKILGSTH